jgi:hypothetical protein
VHARREEHATPFSELMADPAGFGVSSMRQRAPFHRSASVPAAVAFAAYRWAIAANGRVAPSPDHTSSGPEPPTAVQAVPEVHDTPWS